MRRTFRTSLFALLATALLPLSPALGHEADVLFNRNLRGAEFVFEGEVVGVDYKASFETGRDGGGLPHTFVTFEIRRVFKGRVGGTSDATANATANGSEITLRFMGGAGPDDAFFVVGDHPLFDLGDHEVLFVKGNTRMACPLVRCTESRFRLIDGLVYNEDGQEIVRAPRGRVALGPHHDLRQVTTHEVGDVTLGQVTVLRLDEEDMLPEQNRLGPQFTAARFRAFLAHRVRQLHTPAELHRLPPVPSADIRRDFAVAPSFPVPFARPGPSSTPRRTGRISDFLEEQLVRANGGDPRLPAAHVRLIWKIRGIEDGGPQR